MTADAFVSAAGPKQPEHPWSAEAFQVTKFRARYYHDPLPACPLGEVTSEKWPGFSSLKPVKPFRKGVDVVNADGEVEHRTVPLDLYTAWQLLKTDALITQADFYNSVNVARDRSFARGHAIHAAAEATLTGQPIPSWALDNRDAAPYIPHVTAWIDTNVDHVHAIEAVVINRAKGYGGTGDAWLRLRNGIDAYVDWKSRGEDSNHGIYDEEIAQGGAYTSAGYMIAPSADRTHAVRAPLPPATHGVVVSIRPDGTETYYYDLGLAGDVFGHMHTSYRSLSDLGKTATKARKIAVPDAPDPVSVERPAEGAASPSANLARVAQLRERCRTIAELGGQLAAFWPDDLPHLTNPDLTGDDLDRIDQLVTRFETQVSAPFPQPVTNPQPQLEVRLENDSLIPLPQTVPDEGATVELTDPAFIAMTQRYLAVTDTQAQAWMAATVGESIRAGRSIHLATRKSLRRIRIVDGLAHLANAGLATATRGFIYTATDIPQVQDERHSLGACVSIMDAVQAATFVGMCEAATQDLAANTAA